MKRELVYFGLGLTIFSWVACGEQTEQVQETKKIEADTAAVSIATEVDTTQRIQKDGLLLYPAKLAQKFPDATLSLLSPKDDAALTAGLTQFDFSISNYELAVQTGDAAMRHCANSQEGQHLHFIVNNSPYLAKYETSFDAQLSEGNNVVLAFLSRSYHESIKNGSAFQLKNFVVGDAVGTFDLAAPHLFYSRPKGTYTGKDTEKVLLDFYLVNTTLSENGNKVKLTINDTEFILNQWAPYFVEGLPEGENTFRIVLVDAEGNPVPGPFNDSGTRTVVMAK